MDKLGIKATLYDVIGYALPGSLILVGCYLLSLDSDHLKLSELLKVEVSSTFAVLAFIFAYMIGHIVSSVSSFLFENVGSTELAKFIFNFDTSQYDEAAKEVFGQAYSECSPRVVSSYCQINFPIIYDTAFVFLAIYGLSRNISAALLLLTPLFINKDFGPIANVVYLFAIFFSVRNYYRFKVYFTHQIASCLHLPKKTEEKKPS